MKGYPLLFLLFSLISCAGPIEYKTKTETVEVAGPTVEVPGETITVEVPAVPEAPLGESPADKYPLPTYETTRVMYGGDGTILAVGYRMETYSYQDNGWKDLVMVYVNEFADPYPLFNWGGSTFKPTTSLPFNYVTGFYGWKYDSTADTFSQSAEDTSPNNSDPSKAYVIYDALGRVMAIGADIRRVTKEYLYGGKLMDFYGVIKVSEDWSTTPKVHYLTPLYFMKDGWTIEQVNTSILPNQTDPNKVIDITSGWYYIGGVLTNQ